MSLEREVKLAAAAHVELPDLTAVASGVTASAAAPVRLDATYYDTAELVLARWGITLRHRTGEGGRPWTLKLPGEGAGQELVRRELTFPGAAGKVPAAARDLLRAYLRGRPLAPVAHLRTTRTVLALDDREGAPVAEVVDDHVEVLRDDRPAGEFREVEVELRAEGAQAAKLLRSCTARLVRAGCRAEPPVPKAVRALGPAAQAPPEVVVVEVGSQAGTDDVIRRAIARSVTQLLRHDPGARLGDDPEAVHQLRVATRRLRSDLRTFAALLDEGWVDDLRAELAWLGSVVGAVRDADVLAGRLRGQVHVLAGSDAGSGAALLDRLDAERDQARAVMLKGLRSARYDRLLDMLALAAAGPLFSTGGARAATEPPRELLPGLVRRPWRRLAAAANELGAEPSDQALHRVRILAKRCRYAAEAAAPALGRPARRFAAKVEALQDVLGDHQDAVVAEAWLRNAATPEHALAVGELIALQRIERDRLRRAWPAAWAAASARKLRTWL